MYDVNKELFFKLDDSGKRGHNQKSVSGSNGKSSEPVQCAITGPCLRMRHRPSA